MGSQNFKSQDLYKILKQITNVSSKLKTNCWQLWSMCTKCCFPLAMKHVLRQTRQWPMMLWHMP